MGTTAQVGVEQVGFEQVGTGDALPVVPPLDPGTQPWNVAMPARPEPPPSVRRVTQESFCRGPVFPQPTLNPSTIPWRTADNSGEPPAWRRKTLDSWVRGPEFTQPATQQIALLNRALNHRVLAPPRVTGGVQKLQAFVRGKDRSSALMVQTASISKQLATTGILQCKLLFDTSDSANWPSLGDQITISEFNLIRFSGLIDERTYTVYPTSSKIEFTVKAFDWNGLCQRRLVTRDFDPDSLLNIVKNICAQFLGGENIDTGGVDSTINVADAFSFKYIKISDAFNQLALATNTIWWIDHYKILHFISATNAVASGFSIVDSGERADSFSVTDSLANYRNTQYVRTPQDILSESITLTDSHTFSGVNADIVCITRYPLATAPQSVKENGVELVGTSRFFQLKTDGSTTDYPPGGEGYYWAVGFFGIWHWQSSNYPVLGTVLTVTYTGVSTYAGNVVVYKDFSEIASMAAATGGSGIFEEIEDYSGEATYSQALALATGIVQGTVPIPKQFVATTIQKVEDVGRKVTVTLAKYGISQTFVIQSYQQHSLAKNLGYGTTFRTTVTLVSERTLGNWIQWFERLMARLQKSPIQPPTEKPTWALAFDTPENVSTGLVTGSFGAPWAVQAGLGRILYVSAVFASGADRNIVIDIKLNGASIFDSAKLTYTPSDSGTQVRYGNLNSNKVNVTRGDLLTLSVLSTGTGAAPGKNGTIVVVIGQR